MCFGCEFGKLIVMTVMIAMIVIVLQECILVDSLLYCVLLNEPSNSDIQLVCTLFPQTKFVIDHDFVTVAIGTGHWTLQ